MQDNKKTYNTNWLARWCNLGLPLYEASCPNREPGGDCTTCHQYGGLWAVNLTPHAITIENGDGTRITVPPSGTVARVAEVREMQLPFHGIRIMRTKKGHIENLPAPRPGYVYLVSGMVLDSVSNFRHDVYAPDTGPDAIRNDKGHIVAVKGLKQ